MPKWKQCYDSGRKYQSVWEKSFPWVTKAPDGSDSAYCKLCRKTLQVRFSALSAHSKVTDHLARAGVALTTKSLHSHLRKDMTDNVKKIELELAASMCCHCAVVTVDHIGEIISRNGAAEGSKLGTLRLHRTKCTKLITEVISPSLEEELINDLKGKPFSLLVDESTDLSSDKHLCLLL